MKVIMCDGLRTILSALACLGVQAAIALAQSGEPRLAGRITDWQGCPLAGAKVTVTGGSDVSVSGTTDRNGQYELTNVPRGLVVVTAQLAGFEHVELSATVLPDQNLLDVGLALSRLATTKPHQISGVVTDTAGRPLSDASVTLFSVFNPTRPAQTRTDGSGRFRLESHDPGQYVLTAVAVDHRAESRTVVIERTGEAPAAVRLELQRTEYCRTRVGGLFSFGVHKPSCVNS